MKHLTAFAGLALLATLASGVSARADDADNFTNRLFAGKVTPDKKAYACFTRNYDTAHMAEHPQQKVRTMKLLVTAEKMPDEPGLTYAFSLGLNLRNRTGNFDSSGNCSHPEATEVTADKFDLGCGIDCDGGRISIELTNNDKSTRIQLDRIRIWNAKSEDEPMEFDGGKDDRVFRLDRTSLENCPSLVPDRKELAAMLRK
jgi:hypothetical protein